MTKFTTGKYSFGICDRCGDKIPYKKLRKEWTGFKVCSECWDPKTKQEFHTNFPSDPQALYDPRPDRDEEASIGNVSAADSVNGQTPIGKSFDPNSVSVSLGTVTVTISEHQICLSYVLTKHVVIVVVIGYPI